MLCPGYSTEEHQVLPRHQFRSSSQQPWEVGEQHHPHGGKLRHGEVLSSGTPSRKGRSSTSPACPLPPTPPPQHGLTSSILCPPFPSPAPLPPLQTSAPLLTPRTRAFLDSSPPLTHPGTGQGWGRSLSGGKEIKLNYKIRPNGFC